MDFSRKNIIESHKFFIKESPMFMRGTNKIKYFLYFPIAYLKFMSYQIRNKQ